MLRCLAFSLTLLIAVPTLTEAQTNQRTAFNQGMERFNALVMDQKLSDALSFLHPELEITEDDIVRIDNQFWTNYPKAFVGFDTVRTETLKSGFRQEIIAYWDEDKRYFFVYLLIHSTNDGFNVVNVDHGTKFERLNAHF